MATLTETIRATVLDAIRHVKIEDLRDPAVLALLGDVRLRDLVAPSAPKRAVTRKAQVRSSVGKVAYDAAVWSALTRRGVKEVAIDDVVKAVGGDHHQARAALHRLMGSKKVKRTGKTRATRYAAVRG